MPGSGGLLRLAGATLNLVRSWCGLCVPMVGQCCNTRQTAAAGCLEPYGTATISLIVPRGLCSRPAVLEEAPAAPEACDGRAAEKRDGTAASVAGTHARSVGRARRPRPG